MSESANVKFAGLHTSPNPFSETPPGALEVADNVYLRSPSLIEPCRGFTASDASPSGTISRVFPWQDRLMVFHSNGNVRDYSDATGWSATSYFGPSRPPGAATSFDAEPPDATNPIRAASAAESFFFTTASGVRVLDALGNHILNAGLAPPPFLTNTTSTSGSTWLQPGYSAGYCVVLCRYDESGRLIQSAPSSVLIVANGGTTQTYAPGTITKAAGGSIVAATSPAPHGFSVGNSIVVSFGDEANSDLRFSGTYVVASTPTTTTFTWDDGHIQTGVQSAANWSPDPIGPAAAPCSVTITARLPTGVYASGTTFAQLYRTFSAAPGVATSGEFFQVAEKQIPASLFSSGFVTFDADVTSDTFLSVILYTNPLTGDGPSVSNDMPPLARDLCSFGTRLLYANTTERNTLALQLIGTSGLVADTSSITIDGVSYLASTSEDATIPKFQLLTTGTPAQNIEYTARSLCRVVSTYSSNVSMFYASTADDVPGLMYIQENGIGGASFSANADQSSQTCWVPDLSSSATVITSDNNRRQARLWWSNDGEPFGVMSDNWEDVGAEDAAILRAILVRSTVFLFKEDGLYTLQGNDPSVYDIRPFDPGLILLAPESAVVVNNSIYCLTNRGAVYVSESGVSPAISAPIGDDVKYLQANYPTYTTASFGVPDENEGVYYMATPASAADVGCSQQYMFNLSNPSWTRRLISSAVHGAFDPARQALVFVVGDTLYEERRSYSSVDFQNPDGSAIACTIRFCPITVGDPLVQKMFRTMVFTFKTAGFTTCTVGFDTDVSGSTTSSATKAGPGTAPPWGGFPWGTLAWGSSGRSYILRVDMPQSMGIASTLSTTLGISQAQAYWQLQGLSIVFEPSAVVPRRS